MLIVNDNLMEILQGPRSIDINARSPLQNTCPTTGPIMNRFSTSFFNFMEMSLEISVFLHPGNESFAK